MEKRRVLRCGEIFPGCDFVIHGETDAAVLAKLTTHASDAHEMPHIPDALRMKIKVHIRPEE